MLLWAGEWGGESNGLITLPPAFRTTCGGGSLIPAGRWQRLSICFFNTHAYSPFWKGMCLSGTALISMSGLAVSLSGEILISMSLLTVSLSRTALTFMSVLAVS